MKSPYYIFLFFLIVFLLDLCVHYHNYCIGNKLRYTLFEGLESFGFVKYNQLCEKKGEKIFVER